MSDEEEVEEAEELPYEVSLNVPPNKLALHVGTVAIELESTETLDALANLAEYLLKLVYDPEAERKAGGAMGFITERREDE